VPPPKKKSAPPTAAPNGGVNSPRDKIAVRAYGYFLERGGADGWDLDDWLQAERELLDEFKKQPARRKKSAPDSVAAN
jgi:hypothetical protein